MRAKAKVTPICSVRLIAIELKGLAALGEALKFCECFVTFVIVGEAAVTANLIRSSKLQSFGGVHWQQALEILKGFARCRQSLKLYCNKTY